MPRLVCVSVILVWCMEIGVLSVGCSCCADGYTTPAEPAPIFERVPVFLMWNGQPVAAEELVSYWYEGVYVDDGVPSRTRTGAGGMAIVNVPPPEKNLVEQVLEMEVLGAGENDYVHFDSTPKLIGRVDYGTLRGWRDSLRQIVVEMAEPEREMIIEGKIRKSSGEPIEGALVELLGRGYRDWQYCERSDAQGYFRVSGYRRSGYIVKVSVDGECVYWQHLEEPNVRITVPGGK